MENSENTQGKISMGQRLKIIIGTALAIFLIVMIVQNWMTIPLSLVFRKFDVPLPLIVIITLVTGYVWGSFSASRKNKRNESNSNNNSI